jgi:hypothetical protein
MLNNCSIKINLTKLQGKFYYYKLPSLYINLLINYSLNIFRQYADTDKTIEEIGLKLIIDHNTLGLEGNFK